MQQPMNRSVQRLYNYVMANSQTELFLALCRILRKQPIRSLVLINYKVGIKGNRANRKRVQKELGLYKDRLSNNVTLRVTGDRLRILRGHFRNLSLILRTEKTLLFINGEKKEKV